MELISNMPLVIGMTTKLQQDRNVKEDIRWALLVVSVSIYWLPAFELTGMKLQRGVQGKQTCVCCGVSVANGVRCI